MDLNEYLKDLKNLWNARDSYERTINSLTFQIEQLGISKRMNSPNKENGIGDYFSGFFRIAFFAFLFHWFISFPVDIICSIIHDSLHIEFDVEKTSIIISVVILLALCFIIPAILNHKHNKEIRKRRHEIEIYNIKDQERVENEYKLKKTLREEKRFYQEKLSIIEQKIDELYRTGEITKNYRNYNAAILFYDYYSTGRCESIKECMLKFDNDCEIAKMHAKIDLMYAKLEELRKCMLSQIESLRDHMENNLNITTHLINDSYGKNNDDLMRLETNLLISNMIMIDYIEKYKDGGD